MSPHGFTPRTGLRLSGSPFSRFLTGLLVVSALLFVASVAHAVPPKYFEVSDPRLEIRDGEITAKLSINVDNVTGLFEMLKDGASVELLVNTKLERVRTLWTNVTLAEVDLFSSLQHNPLTREFSLYMPGETQPMLDRNLDRLLAATWEKFSATIATLDMLDGDPDSEYQVVLTLNLQHAKPPPWLSKSFTFWSKTILEPEKVVLPFTK